MTTELKTIIASLVPHVRRALQSAIEHQTSTHTTYLEGYLDASLASASLLSHHHARLTDEIKTAAGCRIIADCFAQKPEPEITEGERSLYRWRYKALGGFERSLWDAIFAADSTNLAAIEKGFPSHVQACRRYANEVGYWDALRQRIEQE